MADDFMSAKELQEAILRDSAKAIFHKSYFFVIVGIDPTPVDGKRLIRYSLARYDREMGYRGMPDPVSVEERPHWFGTGTGPTKSIYDLHVHNVTDPEGVLVPTEDYKPQPHRQPGGEWQDPEQFVEKLRRTPRDMMSEYDRSILEEIEENLEQETLAPRDLEHYIQNPEESFRYLGADKWFREGKTYLFRQPTGLYYKDDQPLEISIVKATIKIRDILWSLNLQPLLPKREHTPYHNINPEALHRQIIERLATMTRYVKKLTAANQDLTSGYVTYKVAIVEPQGFTRIYDSIPEAMADCIQYEQALQSEEETMKVAASLTKDEAKILIEAANVLDEKAPLVASLIDSLLTKKESDTFFSKADFAAALLRVANRLDEKGETELANTADQLLQSLNQQEEL